VAKFITEIPLSLLIPYNISFPVAGLKRSSLPNNIFLWYFGNLTHVLVHRRSCRLYQEICPLWGMNIQNNDITHRPLSTRIMYGNLSLRNSSLSTADVIFLCTEEPLPNSYATLPLLPHLTPCISTTSYFDSSFATVMS
jgi:hypothetical protein